MCFPVPEDAGGEDAFGDGKGLGVELEEGEVGEVVGVGVEELVVEDVSGLAGLLLAEDPLLVGVEGGLGWAAFDFVAEGFLLAVGLGQVGLVEGEERAGQDAGDGDDGNDEPVEADTGGLHGGEFAGAVELAEGDEGGDEDAERGDLVEHAGGEVDEVFTDDGERFVVAQDVAHELEEGEYEHEQDKADQDEDEDLEELAEDVGVEDEGKSAALEAGNLAGQVRADAPADATGTPAGEETSPGVDGWVRRRIAVVSRLRFRLLFFLGFGARLEQGSDLVENDSAGGHLAEQEEADDGKESVGEPYGDDDGEFSFLAPGDAEVGEQVVDEDEQKGVDEGHALAAASGSRAERDADEHEDEARGGVGEAAVEFDEIVAAVGALRLAGGLQELAVIHGEDGGVEAPQVNVALGAEGEGPIGLGEVGDIVLAGLVGDHVVLGAVAEADEQALLAVVGDGGRLGGGDAGGGGIGDIGDEKLLPV